MKYIVLLLALSGCVSKLDKVDYMKSPAQFYKDGGGDCEDFANAKKAILGGESVQIPISYPVGHVMLKVDGWLLDNRTNNLIPASSI